MSSCFYLRKQWEYFEVSVYVWQYLLFVTFNEKSCDIFRNFQKVRHVLIWSISGVFSTEVDVTGSSTIHSEARRRARHMSPDSSGAGPKLESLLLHFGRKPSLRSCERWGVREFYLSIYLPIMLYCVVWLLLVGFTGIFVYNFPHVTHLAVELTHRWRG